MRSNWLLLLALVACSCGLALPSAEPLGTGPLARAEAVERANAEAQAEAKAKAAEPDAGKVARPADHPDAGASEPVASAEGAEVSGAVASDGGASSSAEDAGKAPSAKIVYVGEYVGSDVSTFKVGGMDREEKDDKARTRVAVPGPGELAFTFIDSSNGKDICTLTASVSGKKATLTPGQKCWGGDGEAMSGTLTRGTATFDDKKLVIDSDFDLEVGSGEFRMSGTLGYRFEGTRK